MFKRFARHEQDCAGWRRGGYRGVTEEEAGLNVEVHLFSAALFENAEAGSFAADILHHGVRIL